MLRHLLLTTVAVVLAGTGLVSVGGPAQAAGGHTWTVDALISPAPGLLTVRGTVMDNDDGSAPVGLHLYVGGVWSDPNAQFIDLGASSPATGFDRTVEVAKYGTQPIYLYALNAVGADPNPTVLVNGTTVSIRDPNPDGQLMSASSPAPGQVSVTGAALQLDGTEKTRVAITTNGTPAGTLVADQRGPGFEEFPVMFNGTVPSPGGDVRVCATAINQAAGRDKALGCLQVQVAAPPVPPAPPVVPPTPATQAQITLDLKAVRKKSRLRIDVGPDLEQSNYRLRIQRKAHKKWRTVRRTQTLGPRDRITIDLKRGTYRVVVPGQHDMLGARAEARLKR